MTAVDSTVPDESRSFVHRSDRGELKIWLAAPTVLVLKYKGHSDAGYVDFIDMVHRRVSPALPGSLSVFVDAEEQTGYDSAFRTRIAEFAKRTMPRTETVCFFVKSRLVAVGIAIVRTTFGLSTEVVTSRRAFRAKLEAAVQRSRAASPLLAPS